MAVDSPTEPSRFFDADDPGHGPMKLQLQPDGAEFELLRRIGYRDPKYADPFVFPIDTTTFRTDLASIPWVFAWLVPGLGSHLPAVLVHDALVLGKGEPVEHYGPRVDREEADRILRDAMASLGTPVVRRWLIWTGVTIATAAADLRPRWYWLTVVIATLVGIASLGIVATLDLLDVWDVLPWMGDKPWYVEVWRGLIAAIVIPLLVSVAWRRLWPAGAIAGVALAVLLHVTIAVALVGGAYYVLEWLVSRPQGTSPDVKANLDAVT